MKVSSSVKVGILALISLSIFFVTVLWVKGRSFSSAERIEIHFKDVNGMRPGSGVQMMGYRVGQVEEIVPVVDGSASYVKLKFVITAPNIQIPKASALMPIALPIMGNNTIIAISKRNVADIA